MPIAKTIRYEKPSKSKYEVIFEQISDAVLAVDAQGKVTAINPAAEALTGYVAEEIFGRDCRAFFPDYTHSRVPLHSKPLGEELLSTPGTYEDVAFKKKDGLIGLVELNVRQAVDGKGEQSIVIAMRDVTEKKRLERELLTKHAELTRAIVQLERKNTELQAAQQTLVQAGKLAALGELAAGIAHELNQPLQGVKGFAQELDHHLAEKKEMDSTSRQCLNHIAKSVDKMASIIGYLRTYVRKSTDSFELIDLHQPIEEALLLLERQLKTAGITVTRNYDRTVPKVYVNSLQLEQVFINLATNARDAIGETERGSGNIRISTSSKDKIVEVRFEDDGVGMSERTLEKAFNPFFSTKEVGKGMGLGLSLSYGLISKLNGTIVAESQIGKGTTFIVRIPKDWRDI